MLVVSNFCSAELSHYDPVNSLVKARQLSLILTSGRAQAVFEGAWLQNEIALSAPDLDRSSPK
jgi:hypothetical protein